MPSVQLPECTRKEGSQGTADEVGRQKIVLMRLEARGDSSKILV